MKEPLKGPLKEYLASTPVIDASSPSIREKAEELTTLGDGAAERAVRLFSFVRDRIAYDIFSDYLSLDAYRASATLRRGRGFCIQKAVLLAALARASGIPSRLCFADIRNYRVPPGIRELMGTDLFVYHGYCELHMGGEWVKATPTFDLDTCERHGFVPVEFDGHRDAVLPSRDRSGRPHIAYIRRHGCFPDLPFERIMAAFARAYASVNLERWQMAARKNASQGD
jgi:transglutaminase-like putative cysteine protease